MKVRDRVRVMVKIRVLRYLSLCFIRLPLFEVFCLFNTILFERQPPIIASELQLDLGLWLGFGLELWLGLGLRLGFRLGLG